MLMIIFGAGASHDSSTAFPLPQPPHRPSGGPWRPPLGADLFRDPDLAFGKIVRRYPKLHHILPYLREPAGRTVEEELEFLKDQAHPTAFPERYREFFAVRYYLRDLLFEATNQWLDRTNGVTNYAPLIGDILRLNGDDEPVCLVTFNYDLLLDNALLSYGYHPQEPRNQLRAHSVLQLFRPHGSVGWVRFVNTPENLTPTELIEQAETIQPGKEWANVDIPEQADNSGLGRTAIPAIAIPFQNKSQSLFECPETHLYYLRNEVVPRVTKILIIGWQAREAHFLSMLRDKLAQLKHLMVVGRDAADAGNTLQYFVGQIRKEGSDVASYVGSGGFSNFIRGREAEPFLAK